MITNAINTIVIMADKKYDQETMDVLTDVVLSGTNMIIDIRDTVKIKPYEDLLTKDDTYFTVMNFIYTIFPDFDDFHTLLLANNANLTKKIRRYRHAFIRYVYKTWRSRLPCISICEYEGFSRH